MKNYWIKDETRQEIITKALIPNNGNFELFASYYNLMDAKGLSFQFKENSKLQAEKLVRKNGFEYFVLQQENFNELMILPNQNLVNYLDNIISNINLCNNENVVLNFIISKM